jgi:hypothetical protein
MRYPPQFTDTTPEAMKVWLDLLRRKPPGEKLAATLQLTALAIRFQEAGVRLRYPHASEREVFLRAASQRLPRDLMIRVYGWAPESDGGTC